MAGGRTGRLSSSRWERTRKEVLERDGYRCQRCGKAGILEVHHVTPLQDDPAQDPYDPDGCLLLCRGCHILTHREMRNVNPTQQISKQYE